MNAVFADTSYYVALLLRNDKYHVKAAELTRGLNRRVVTTAWVLAELGGFLSAWPGRASFVSFVRDLRADPSVHLADVNMVQFEAGLNMYAARPDKAWSLVDCISFHIMEQNGITEAWTTDRHFEQAGFSALLR